MRPVTYRQPVEEPAEPAEPSEAMEPMEEPPATQELEAPPSKSKPKPNLVEEAAPEEFEEFYDDELPMRGGRRSIWGPVWEGDCPPRGEPLGCRSCVPRWAVTAEYLLWFRRGMTLPPLVTTSFEGTTLENAGVLGEATTTVLFGNQTVGDGSQSGGRLTVMRWMDDEDYFGFGGRAFILDTQNDTFAAATGTNPILARPYFDVSDGQAAQQNSLVISFPNVQTGQVNVNLSSDVLGGDFFVRRQIYSSCKSRVDLWLGYQYSRITSDLIIDSTSTEASGATLEVTDQFGARNEFHAVTLGFVANYDRPTWHCELLAKIGLGRMHQSVTMSGSNTIIDQGQRTPSPEGLLVRSTNTGTFAQDDFAVSPELGVSWTWHAHRLVDVTVGYSFIYWTSVLSAPGAIDPNLAVNLSDPPTGAQNPAVNFGDTSYWLHGVSVGLSGRF